MRFVLRVLVFAAGFLVGGEALRRWLEKDQAEAPTGRARHLRAVPQPEPTPATPKPALASAATGAAAPPMSKAELYQRAQRLDIGGRSKMSKAELAEAVARAEAKT